MTPPTKGARKDAAKAPRSAAAPRAKAQPTGSTAAAPAAKAPPSPSDRALAWLHSAQFATTAAELHQLPAGDVPEIAFVGRSNAGKSSAINALAQRRQLAFASKTPGRTQHINLFALGAASSAQADAGWPTAYLADLPGYGYASVARGAKLRWQQVMADYLALRRNLAGVVLLVDSRLGLTDLDTRLLNFIEPRVRNGEIALLVVLTKADKLNRKEQSAAERALAERLGEMASEESDVGVLLFSAPKKQGLGDLALAIMQWAEAAALPVLSAAPMSGGALPEVAPEL